MILTLIRLLVGRVVIRKVSCVGNGVLNPEVQTLPMVVKLVTLVRQIAAPMILVKAVLVVASRVLMPVRDRPVRVLMFLGTPLAVGLTFSRLDRNITPLARTLGEHGLTVVGVPLEDMMAPSTPTLP